MMTTHAWALLVVYGVVLLLLAIPIAMTLTGAIGFNRMQHESRGHPPQ